MAIKPKKARKEKYPIDETVEEFFLTGESSDGTQGHELRLGRFFDDDMIPEIWAEHGKRLIKKWKAEGVTEETWVQEYVRHESDPYQWYLDQKEGKKHGLQSMKQF